jgi:hypothetical protein
VITFAIKRSGPPLPDLVQQHYAPALVHGINNTIERIQEVTRAQMASVFITRSAASKRLLRNYVSIDPDEFASLRPRTFRGRTVRPFSFVGRVGLKASLNAQEAVRRFAARIVRFEFGGVETARGGKPLYVPTKALRSSPNAQIQRALYPKALGLLESRQIEGGDAFHGQGKKRKAGVHRTGSGKVQLKGKRRTFAIDPRFSPEARAVGIWQRRIAAKRVNFGPSLGKSSDTQKLWNYLQSVRYPRRLTFREDSQRIVATHLPGAIREYLQKRTIQSLVRGIKR